ncbi:MAG: diacylglycerol kinase family lipid kinase [Elusimicrobiota bacterium]
MSYFFIINPNSGKKREKAFIEQFIRDESEKRKFNFEIHYTKSKGHACELSAEAALKGFNTVVAVGGDGTIREAASSLVGEGKPALAVVPLGSGNGLARNLCLPLDWKKALEVVFRAQVRRIDAGLCNGELFLCACGFGIDALIARKFNSGNHGRGLIPYFISGFSSFLKFGAKLTRVKVGNGEIFQLFPLIGAVMNGRQYGGGAVINPEGLIDDGFLELVTVPSMGFFSAILKVPYIFNGKIMEKKVASFLRIKNVEILLGRDSLYHLDGEDFFSPEGVLKVSVLPGALKVIVSS